MWYSITVLKFLRASNLIESNSKGVTDELYLSDLTEQHKKNIINVAIGKCGKISNSRNIVKLYLNEEEAYYYKNLYNGYVYPITSTKIHEDITYNDDVFLEHLFDESFKGAFAPKKMYLVVIEKECKLEENMLPIKHFIYVNQQLKKITTL